MSTLTMKIDSKGSKSSTFVQIPEQEQFSATSRGTTHVTEQIGVWVPEHAVETQNDL